MAQSSQSKLKQPNAMLELGIKDEDMEVVLIKHFTTNIKTLSV